MEHVGHAVARQRSAGDGIDLCLVVCLLLCHGQGDGVGIFTLEEMLTLELLLPFAVVLDLGTEAGRLTLVIEVSAEDGTLITVDGDVSGDAAPEAFIGMTYFCCPLMVA